MSLIDELVEAGHTVSFDPENDVFVVCSDEWVFPYDVAFRFRPNKLSWWTRRKLDYLVWREQRLIIKERSK